MTKDPVCNMEIEGGKPKLQATHMGKNFDFCSESCKKKFEADPMAYMKDKGHGTHGHGKHSCC